MQEPMAQFAAISNRSPMIWRCTGVMCDAVVSSQRGLEGQARPLLGASGIDG
jgi:hypothetical protein